MPGDGTGKKITSSSSPAIVDASEAAIEGSIENAFEDAIEDTF